MAGEGRAVMVAMIATVTVVIGFSPAWPTWMATGLVWSCVVAFMGAP